MEHSNEIMPFSAPPPSPESQTIDPVGQQESESLVRTDRLYQIAAVTAGLILLATAL
jgi:hypothetical protein